jgi:hypothetical protein
MAATGQPACASGHSGPMCTVCTDGWARSTGLRCETCADGDHAAFVVWLVLIMFALPLVYVALHYCKGRSSMAHTLEAAQNCVSNLGTKLRVSKSWYRTTTVKLKILITFLQVLSQIHTVYEIPYPPAFEVFVQRMAFVNLDLIDVMRVGCVARVDYYGKLFAVTLVPIVLSALLYVLACCQQAMRNTCTKAFLLLTFIIFPSVSTTVLRAFPCRDFDGDYGSRLKADYSIDCNAPGRPGYVVYAVFMTLVYPFGIPALYAVLLWKQRKDVCPEKREWTKLCGCGFKISFRSWTWHFGNFDYPPPALSVAKDKELLELRNSMLSAKDDEASAMLRSTQFLFKEYEPRYWWFEIFECARRLMLTGGTVFFLEGSATQVAAGILVALVSIHVYADTHPFIDKKDDRLAMAAQWSIFFTLFSGLLLKTKVPSDDGYAGALGGLLIFFNAMVIALAIGTFVYEVFGDKGGTSPTDPTNPMSRTTSSSIGSTTINPMVTGPAQQSKPLAKGGSSHHKESNAKLSKQGHNICAPTHPMTQGEDSEPNPTAQL